VCPGHTFVCPSVDRCLGLGAVVYLTLIRRSGDHRRPSSSELA
jgi:hypothetical protein